MAGCLFFLVTVGFTVSGVNGQFFFNQPQPQPFFNFFNPQPFRPFQNPFAPPTTTVATTTVEFIPDPDKEVGNFPMPNPANWPVGPDWNDPRNNQDQQLGWGGNGLIGTTSTLPPPPSTTVLTTRPTLPVVIVPDVVAPAKKPVPSPVKKQPPMKRSSLRSEPPTPSPAQEAPLRRTKKAPQRGSSGSRRRLSASKRSH